MFRQQQHEAAMVRGWRPAPPPPPPRRRQPTGLLACAAAVLATLAAVLLLLPHTSQVDSSAPVQQLPAAEIDVQAPLQAVQTAPSESVSAGLPENAPTEAMSIPVQRLVKGRLMLVDEAHPLPDGYIPADTFGVLNQTSGRVTCRDLAAVLGEDILSALDEMFAAAHNSLIFELTVFAGTRSPEQQRQLQTDTLASLARDMSLEDALALTRQKVASPGCSEHQMAWAVDIRLCEDWNDLPSTAPLSASAAGQWLIENCWKYGLIQRWPDADPSVDDHKPYHFRYVGRAHAMLMHALNMTLEEYLAFLHEHGAVTLYDENNAPAAAAICVAVGERQASFMVPSGAAVEDASLDNLGYAVVSCLY